MDETFKRWSELEPQAVTYAPGANGSAGRLQVPGARDGGIVLLRPDWPDNSEGQGVLLHALWHVIETRGWRWTIMFAPNSSEERGEQPYLANVDGASSDNSQTERGVTPAHALLTSYVALLKRQPPSDSVVEH